MSSEHITQNSGCAGVDFKNLKYFLPDFDIFAGPFVVAYLETNDVSD